jgi:hypothetical protein
MGTLRSTQNATTPTSSAHIHWCGMNTAGSVGNRNAFVIPEAKEKPMNGSDKIVNGLYPNALTMSP